MAKDAFAEKDDAMTGWGENRHVEGEGRGWNFLIRGGFPGGVRLNAVKGYSSTWFYDIDQQANCRLWGLEFLGRGV